MFKWKKNFLFRADSGLATLADISEGFPRNKNKRKICDSRYLQNKQGFRSRDQRQPCIRNCEFFPKIFPWVSGGQASVGVVPISSFSQLDLSHPSEDLVPDSRARSSRASTLLVGSVFGFGPSCSTQQLPLTPRYFYRAANGLILVNPGGFVCCLFNFFLSIAGYHSSTLQTYLPVN